MGLSLSFGAFACGYSKSLVRDPHSFKKALSVFKTIINALLKQSLA
ncbi:hypothetical protein HMPREF1431_01152 [Helicobacter pylori GAMchJs106B]|nr:hypothetical protein [Helicobacter pylori]EMH42306.1 hypothetical protein HMPREF1431_01152 [Helicobacter pylori GAMchJs106B]